MHNSTLDATIGALLTGVKALGVPTEAFFSRKDPWPVRMAARITGQGKISAAGPMRSVFTHLKGEHPELYLTAAARDGRLRLPVSAPPAGDPEALRALRDRLSSGLARLEPEEEWIGALIALLEDCLSFVPGVEPDISAYDQAAITASLAACISEYMLATGMPPCSEGEFRKKEAFLLYSADFSGIQKFIFTVSTRKALASLRSRSFFLELLMEHYIDELLAACALSRANLLYSGGGHCYLLLPNTDAVRTAVQKWNRRFNDWLVEEFGVQLFAAHGYTACTANDLTNEPAADAPYTAMFRRVSGAIAEHKNHRYCPEQILRLNRPRSRSDGRECVICGRTDRLNADDRCPWCELFASLSAKILTGSLFLVSSSHWDSEFHLPGWDAERYIAVADERTAHTAMADEAVIRMYVKNRAMELMPWMARIYVGDYAASLQMEELTAASRGIRRLAVCRMDVDDLGHAFVAGYRVPGETDPVKRDRYLTIARTSAFSRQMSLFFKGYLNGLLEGLSVAIVYSGGDDVFMVGAWDAVIDGTRRIQAAFDAFCGGSLTISAGITLHAEHFPIRMAAAQSAELEDCAKQMPGKNALALFDAEGDHIYSWQEFGERVVGEKLALLQRFFESEELERGNSFLYQLLEFLRQCDDNRINLARYAYLLARMEPREKERRELYRTFSGELYRWGLSASDRRQLITAIYLLIYMGKKGS